MRIFFVSDSIYPYHKGGKEKRLFEISTRLVRSGHEVHIWTMQWWPGEKIKKENNVTLHGVCRLTTLYVKGRRSIWQAIYFSLKIFFPLLKEYYDILEADHMPHFPVISCKIICLLKRKKLFVTWHEVWGEKYWQEYLGLFPGIFGHLIEKLSVKCSDIYIAVSNLTKERLINLFNVSKEKIYVVSNGVNYEKILTYPEVDKKFSIVFAGRLIRHKNVHMLLQLVKLANINALIIGEGPERKSLEELSRELKIDHQVVFSNFLEEDRFFPLLKSGRIFLSLSTREGFGIAALEANACGLPVIIVDHPENATKEIIKDGLNGFICLFDFSEISRKIKRLLDDKKLYENIKQNAIREAQKYNWEKICKNLLMIYQNNGE